MKSLWTWRARNPVLTGKAEIMNVVRCDKNLKLGLLCEIRDANARFEIQPIEAQLVPKS